MNERPSGITTLMWALIIIGMLGVFGNGLGTLTAVAMPAILDMSSTAQQSLLDSAPDDPDVAAIFDSQQAMMDEMVALSARTQPISLGLGILGMLVSVFLVFAAFRGLRGGNARVLLERALWAASGWAVLKFGAGFWLQQAQFAVSQARMEESLEIAGIDPGSGAFDVTGMQDAMVAVGLAFGALVVVCKVLLYGYGIWTARQPEGRHWLEQGTAWVDSEPAATLPPLS